MKLGILGLGKMACAVVQGLKKAEQHSEKKLFSGVQATVRSVDSAKKLSHAFSIECHSDNLRLVRECDVILLGVLPHQAQEVLKASQSDFRQCQTLISICASVTQQELNKWTRGKLKIVRVVPNTPCLVGAGMTLICESLKEDDQSSLNIAERLFQTIGQTVRMDEKLLDGAMAISGCGPAFGYVIIEALSDAGVQVGLSRKVATTLASQMLFGSARMMLESEKTPSELKQQVTTPGGCTIHGLYALEKGNIRSALIEAVVAAHERAKTLRNESSPR